MSVGFRNRGSGYVDPKQVDSAEDDLLKHCNVDCKHSVPFCAGMSKDGNTLYVDSECYDEVVKRGMLKPLIVHEMVEHCLMCYCGLPYEEAHAIATAAEENCVKSCGHNLNEYNAVWDKIIRKVGSRGKYKNIPEDLDTEPYEQEAGEADDDEGKEGGLMGKAAYGGKAYGPIC